MTIEQFGITKEYYFSVIEKEVNDFVDLVEYGPETVGENFIVLKSNESNKVCSFILTGGTSKDFIYKCIYNDWQ